MSAECFTCGNDVYDEPCAWCELRADRDSLRGLADDLIAERDGLAAEVERLRKRCESHRRHAASATDHLAALGWVPAGTHADRDPIPPLEFSAEGADGLPDWERVAPADGAKDGPS